MGLLKDGDSKFQAAKQFTATGVIGGSSSEPFSCRGLQYVRVQFENVASTNIVKVYARIRGAASFLKIVTLRGSSTKYIPVSGFDEFYFDCTTYGASGGTPKLVASGNFNFEPGEFRTLLLLGFIGGQSIVTKFGTNSDIDTGTVPEDIWEGGGAYNGWATAAEICQIASASANDTAAGTGARTVQITGLDANYDVQSETLTLNGTSQVDTVNSYIRIHTATVLSAGSGGVNAGILTVRQKVTTANVFLSMVAGRNQTNCSAYTVPAGFTAIMEKITSAPGTSSVTSLEGAIWTRTFGQVFRSRRPFFISDTVRLTDDPELVFTEKADIIGRITSVSANNTPVNFSYRLLLVENHV